MIIIAAGFCPGIHDGRTDRTDRMDTIGWELIARGSQQEIYPIGSLQTDKYRKELTIPEIISPFINS